ncbi:MAG: OadG-related small transporter subunit [Sphaerochaeta sp.]|jgi:hypothetical protein|nr:OadG-related small transporter subunit [uncultured Sphaerochaeta sp.]MDD3059002.1 OadG-related small transporter subunit [Sphaerochaeta sp.]MDD3930014.1 OadG-related small transporter subunit [Sphaerochaeta sp.]
MYTTFLKSLTLMGQGMAGIFTVILVIFVVLSVLGRKKDKSS